jgi:predicted amidophosphoribosyltransferase
MPRCSRCDAEIPAANQFCGNCGAPASAAALAVVVGLGLWGMRMALAGQPLWKEDA